MNQKLAVIVLGILVIAGGLVVAFLYSCEDDWCFVTKWQKVRAAESFERCVSLGFPVLESYPRQCHAGKKSFADPNQPPIKPLPIPAPSPEQNIHVTAPLPDALVESPLVVRGEARGTWYFEASFPVRLLDANSKVLAVVPAQAKSDWMTTNFVPFEIMLTFDTPATKTGTLVLVKDNPSGLLEHDASVSIPVRFKTVNTKQTTTGQLEGVMTIGPVCPALRIDDPCKPTPEMFAARKVFVYQSNRTTLVTMLTPDGEGKFGATLPAGEYWVDMPQQGIGGVSGTPTEIHIAGGATAMLTIDVDTGIR